MSQALVLALLGLWIGVGLVVGVEVSRWLKHRAHDDPHD